MALPRTPVVSYMYGGGTQAQQFTERDNRDADINNKPADNRPVTQLSQDHRAVRNDEQDNSGQNTWRQPETERWDTRQPESRPETERGQPLSAHGQVRRGVDLIDERSNRLDRSVDKLEKDWEDVPNRVEGVESAMAARGPQIDELNQTRAIHSARIEALEQAVNDVKLQNTALKEELVRRGEVEERMFRNGHVNTDQRAGQMSERQGYYNQGQGQGYGQGQGQSNGQGQNQGYGQGQGYGQRQDYGQSYGQSQGMGYGYHDTPGFTNAGGYQQQHANGQPGQGDRRTYENEQHKGTHGTGDGYLGMKKFYNPELMTSYRREQATFKIATTGGLGEEEEWNRKRREEEDLFLKEKPRTYAYTRPYEAHRPPPDVNKFFHDSKHMYMTERPPTTSDVYPMSSVPFKNNPGTGMSTYEMSYLTPRGGKQTNVAGVMYVIRYEDAGFDDVRTALREQQTVMHSHQGSIIGIARPSHICVLEGLEDWTPARRNSPKPNVSVPHRCVDEDIAVLWFPSFERANDFANNSHKNRFRQMDFPTPMAADIFTLQMNSPLYQRELDTFLFFELLGVRRYSAENLKHFEEEVRERMLGFSKNCIPLVVSHYMEGKEALRRGSRGQLFRHQSKVYVSRFSSLEDVADLWKSNVIQNCRDAWGIHGPVNTFAISLRDFRD